jgi:replicative DNA helicase
MPNSQAAEMAVLGSLLIDPNTGGAWSKVAGKLRADDFYQVRHQTIYSTIAQMHRHSVSLDHVTLSEALERQGELGNIGGDAYLIQVVNETPTSANIEAYAEEIIEAAGHRSLIADASDVVKRAYEREPLEELLGWNQTRLFERMERRGIGQLTNMRDAVSAYYDRIEHMYRHPQETLGVPSGLKYLDKLLRGFKEQELIILAGRPGMGKTSLLITIAVNAAKQGLRVAFFSLEMSEEQIVNRIVSMLSGIDNGRLAVGQLREDEWPAFIQATGELSELPIFVDDTGAQTPAAIRARATRLKAEHGLDLMIGDYLQLMAPDEKKTNRVQELSSITKMSKAAAKELKVPYLLASQLSRAVERRADRRPVPSDTRDSGTIEEDADTVILLYRDEVYNPQTEQPNIAEIIVGKNRNGPQGMVPAFFRKETASFVNVELVIEEPIYI